MGVCLGLLSAPVFAANPAASFSTLFSFDLHTPSAGVVEGDGVNAGYVFGTTSDVSLSYGGGIYKASMSGGAPQVVYQLKDTDGYSPLAPLLLGKDHYLYGTTHSGPLKGGITTSVTGGVGTLFRVAQDGSGFTTMHNFGATDVNGSYVDGVYPDHALIDDSVYVYGVTTAGGLYGSGTVFRLRKADGLYQVLHQFAAITSTGASSNVVNGLGEGSIPSASLILASDGRLYGVTSTGGVNLWTTAVGTIGTGTIFSLNTDGSDFQTVYNFSALDSTATIPVNGDGIQPHGSLIETNAGVLIGTTTAGGTPTDTTLSGYGTVFSFNTSTRQLTTFYNFDATTGATPIGKLVLDNGRVYGLTSGGSTTSTPVTIYGGIYSIDVNGGNFAITHAFNGIEGAGVTDGLIKASNGDLFGVLTSGSGCTVLNGSGFGAAYRYSLTTGSTASGYANCTQPTNSSGGGSMSPGLLWLLATLGLVPAVRRRLFAFNS